MWCKFQHYTHPKIKCKLLKLLIKCIIKTKQNCYSKFLTKKNVCCRFQIINQILIFRNFKCLDTCIRRNQKVYLKFTTFINNTKITILFFFFGKIIFKKNSV